MNKNKFKVLLCCYIMGIAGCNKIDNPGYAINPYQKFFAWFRTSFAWFRTNNDPCKNSQTNVDMAATKAARARCVYDHINCIADGIDSLVENYKSHKEDVLTNVQDAVASHSKESERFKKLVHMVRFDSFEKFSNKAYRIKFAANNAYNQCKDAEKMVCDKHNEILKIASPMNQPNINFRLPYIQHIQQHQKDAYTKLCNQVELIDQSYKTIYLLRNILQYRVEEELELLEEIIKLSRS
ncbi:hypothetical protein [Cardinium endosymbiont of Philonthus spinipes]|uniref:hypothetical protein n=1 Tax=Cardinium endosymbiont of Philonthus spinipes TaxID=3077941 RepID=UPI00313B52EF